MSTALAFLPAGVMVMVLSTRMASLLGRFGPTPLTGLAFTCLVLAYAVFLRAGIPPDYPAVMLPATLLVGLAFGLGFSSLSVAATAGVPDAEQGLAASLFQTSFQVGGALVLAIHRRPSSQRPTWPEARPCRRDDDHHGRSARAGTARAPAASGAESGGGRQDRPAPADVPARQVAAQPARARIVVLPGVHRGPGELLAALLDQGLRVFRIHGDGSS